MSELLTASGPRLTALLLELPAADLAAALDNPNLREEQLVAALRRRDLSGEFLATVAKHMGWAGQYLVKVVITMHPRTPKPVSMNFVKFLFWRDLVKVTNNFAIDPPVRVAADNVLAERLDEMELGERIALARLGSRSVVRSLKVRREEPVFAALLMNPRLTEDDLLPLCHDPGTPAGILSLVAQNARWGARYGLRLALARNPATPMAVALSQLISLNPRDLKDLHQNPSAPKLIRQAALRVLETQNRRRAGNAGSPGEGGSRPPQN